MTRRLVPIAAIDLDRDLWTWVHQHIAGSGDYMATPRESPIYPVVERLDRLVLLANFESFVEVRAAGLQWVDVWVGYWDPGFTARDMAEDYSSGLGDEPK